MKTITWTAEPNTTTNQTSDGILHHTGDDGFGNTFEVRFDFTGGIDRWTLVHIQSNRKWTRDGINEGKTCKGIASSFLNWGPKFYDHKDGKK